MSLDYRVEQLPDVWPGKATPPYARKRPQFKTIWTRALDLLAREIAMLRCDTFTYWQENIDAIARALEALRLVNRYGVQQGKQYTGFKAIPPTTAPTMDVETAATVLAGYHPVIGRDAVVRSRAEARECLRYARAKAHPDAGGTTERWHVVELASQTLARHFGVTAL
jgi:hypothetical protein